MLKAFDFCIPIRGTKVPSSPDWLHEIKYDGYRVRLEREGDRARLFSRNGYDPKSRSWKQVGYGYRFVASWKFRKIANCEAVQFW
jgi:ATP-dependent DNA ligase